MLVMLVVVISHCLLHTPVAFATDDKIVGGIEVNIKNYPYQVALERFNDNFCSGAVVAVDKILTAGHCVQKSGFSVRYGSDRILSGGTVVSVGHISRHPLYVKKTYDYDVAVLTLTKHLKFNDRCKIVPLSKNTEGGNRTCWASGWGNLKNNKQPKKLNAVKLKEVPYDNCQKAWMGQLTDRMICFREKGKDTCQGDSGGPLVDQVKYELVGITSFGQTCADPLYPGVYANVAVLYYWIVKEINTKRVDISAKSSATKIGSFIFSFIKAV